MQLSDILESSGLIAWERKATGGGFIVIRKVKTHFDWEPKNVYIPTTE